MIKYRFILFISLLSLLLFSCNSEIPSKVRISINEKNERTINGKICDSYIESVETIINELIKIEESDRMPSPIRVELIFNENAQLNSIEGMINSIVLMEDELDFYVRCEKDTLTKLDLETYEIHSPKINVETSNVIKVNPVNHLDCFVNDRLVRLSNLLDTLSNYIEQRVLEIQGKKTDTALIIFLKPDEGIMYSTLQLVEQTIASSIEIVYDKYSQDKYGKTYSKLEKEEQEKILSMTQIKYIKGKSLN